MILREAGIKVMLKVLLANMGYLFLRKSAKKQVNGDQ